MRINLIIVALAFALFTTGCQPGTSSDVIDQSVLKVENVRLIADQDPTMAQLDSLVREYLRINPQDFDIRRSKLTVDVFFQGLENRARFDFASTIPNDDRTLHVWVSQQGKVRLVKIDTPETADAG
jgi:endonuclease YncB( thermonuclease family)